MVGGEQGRKPWQARFVHGMLDFPSLSRILSCLPVISTYLPTYTQALVIFHAQHLKIVDEVVGAFRFRFSLFVLDLKGNNMGKPPRGRRCALMLALALICFLSGATRRANSARVFTIINQCKTDIWPAVTPGESFGGGGFLLHPGQSMVFTAPVGWVGRIWGRTGCNFDVAGNGTCETGACGTSLRCAASGAIPASLAEFTLASVDYYDVNLVDGFNLPMVVTPGNGGGQGNCTVAGCDGDLRQDCPSELAVKVGGRTVACRSACDVFETDQYCCRGQYGNPVTCQPSFYSKKFKAACPTAYSYAYDDPTSIFTCSQSPDYTITFCSTRKQSVCSYHNNRLVCSGSSRSWPIMPTLTLLSSILALQFSL